FLVRVGLAARPGAVNAAGRGGVLDPHAGEAGHADLAALAGLGVGHAAFLSLTAPQREHVVNSAANPQLAQGYPPVRGVPRLGVKPPAWRSARASDGVMS